MRRRKRGGKKEEEEEFFSFFFDPFFPLQAETMSFAFLLFDDGFAFSTFDLLLRGVARCERAGERASGRARCGGAGEAEREFSPSSGLKTKKTRDGFASTTTDEQNSLSLSPRSPSFSASISSSHLEHDQRLSRGGAIALLGGGL